MDDILILGANGKVGRRLIKELKKRNKHVRAMIRDKAQLEEIEALGAVPYLGDLEEDFSDALNGINVVIFTAGSGSSTGPEKTVDVDQEAAKKSMDLAKQTGVKLYIMVSAQGAKNPELSSPIQHYYVAKRNADDYLMNVGIDYLIFRPGKLLDEKGEGKIQIDRDIPTRGSTHRDDLAKAIAEAIDMPDLRNEVLEILNGRQAIKEALASI